MPVFRVLNSRGKNLLIYMWGGYSFYLIKSFENKITLKVWQQEFIKSMPQEVQDRALHKLVMINNTGKLEDLRLPPGNHLEKLYGDRIGQYSIRIQKQYWICFNYSNGEFLQCWNSWLSLGGKIKMAKNLASPKMSSFLWDDFMKPLHISAYKLAKEINVPVSRIQDILHDRRKITADTSIRLGRYFGISDDYFFKIQNELDLRNVLMKNKSDFDAIRRVTVKQ